jgi:lipoate-protein ligase A
MALDEAVLEHVQRGEAKTTLRLFGWKPACLSLGQAQSFADVDMSRLRDHGWDVVRRLTGGRAILHTDEITYSIAGAAEDPRLVGTVLESYSRLARALRSAVTRLGVAVEMREDSSPWEQPSNPVCFEVPSAYEITFRGRKLVGSAQARRKGGVLQHGSIPLTGNLGRICDVLNFKSEAERQAASGRLLARAITVEEALGRPVSWQTAADAMVRGFEEALGIRLKRAEPSAGELERTDELVSEKYAQASWNERI